MKLWKRYGYPKPKSEASRGELSLIDNEIYSGIETPRMAVFLRLDGWKFHKVTKKLKLKEPFDKKFIKTLVKIIKKISLIFNADLGYAFSDEINILFTKTPGFRRVEKIDSVMAGIASSILTKEYKKNFITAFDCRAIPVKKSEILKYLIWRQAEAFRNHNNSWAQWALKKKGFSPYKTNRKLHGLKSAELLEIVRQEIGKTPSWTKKGVLVYREEYLKKGWDPIKKKEVLVKRRRFRTTFNPPLFDTKEGRKFIKKVLKVF